MLALMHSCAQRLWCINIFLSVLRGGVLIYFQMQLIDHGSRSGTVAVRIEEQDNECLKASTRRRRIVKELINSLSFCGRTGERCSMTFKPCGLFGNELHKVEGYILDKRYLLPFN